MAKVGGNCPPYPRGHAAVAGEGKAVKEGRSYGLTGWLFVCLGLALPIGYRSTRRTGANAITVQRPVRKMTSIGTSITSAEYRNTVFGKES